MQLMLDFEHQAWNVHVTVRDADNRDAAPLRTKDYRDITLSSLERFYAVSDGKRTAYSYRGVTK